MSRAYYNENDPRMAQWLRALIEKGLIAPGDVDERSIEHVQASDLDGYDQCHFFAGIGGWSYALRLAGWPDDVPVWTGSCPCQPWSCAGSRKGGKDPRHLWPHFFRLIRIGRPVGLLGEQTSTAIRWGWLDGIFADLEGEDYACGAAVLGAHSVTKPHIRQRVLWLAYPECFGWPWRGQCQTLHEGTSGPASYGTYEGHYCRDGERWIVDAYGHSRRIPDRLAFMADGIPGGVAQLHGIGNAIVPELAAEFIIAASECLAATIK